MVYDNEKGVSLVEVIAAIVLLSIILITFMSFFPHMGRTNDQNSDTQLALNIAKQELNNWKKELEALNSTEFNDFLQYRSVTFKNMYMTNDEEAEDTYIKLTDTRLKDSDYSVEILVAKESDIETKPIKAYQLIIKILKDENIYVTETYGYVFIEDEFI